MPFKLQQAKYAYNMPVLCQLRDMNMAFTGQPWARSNAQTFKEVRQRPSYGAT